eukprot:5459957-Amphidinium_carterae.1
MTVQDPESPRQHHGASCTAHQQNTSSLAKTKMDHRQCVWREPRDKASDLVALGVGSVQSEGAEAD